MWINQMQMSFIVTGAMAAGAALTLGVQAAIHPEEPTPLANAGLPSRTPSAIPPSVDPTSQDVPPPTTTATPTSTAVPSTGITDRTVTHAPSNTVAVRGKVSVVWSLTKIPGRVFPADCRDIGASYQVKISDGAGTILAVVPFTNGRVASRRVDPKYGFLTMTCGFTYSSHIDSPSAVFTVEAGSKLSGSSTEPSVRTITRGELGSIASMLLTFRA
ncbi:hypothetical protein ACWCOV_12430 [Kribbella sp. NPDC002412]